MPHKAFIRFPLVCLVAIATIVLFACSSFRHSLFQSTAFDLGIFDNAIYLISQGQEPIVSFRGLHILGDHAAWMLYPLALLYAVIPDVHWLFAARGPTTQGNPQSPIRAIRSGRLCVHQTQR